MSIVETLVVISLSGVVVSGIVKAALKATATSNVRQTQEDTRKLKEQVYQILTNACIENLNPTNLHPVSTPTTGLQKIKKLVFTNEQELFNFDPNDSSNNKKKFGESIQAVGITLKEDTPIADSSNIQKKKTFYLYYKYISTGLGARQTKGGDPTKCIEGGDLSGCHYLSCIMNYECAGDCNSETDLTQCNPLDCSVTEIDVDCPPGKFLVSLTGDKKCVGCKQEDDKPHKVLISISENGEALCLENTECEPGHVATGINKENGEYKVVCIQQACENGYPVLVNGQMECKTICHGGQRLNEENICECPPIDNSGSGNDLALDANGNCICSDRDKELSPAGNCVCKGDKVMREGMTICLCPEGQTPGPVGSGTCYCSPGSCPTDSCKCEHGKDSVTKRCIKLDQHSRPIIPQINSPCT